MVDGLHWAAVNIDNKQNIALAKKFGVLDEGIPNVKLVNAADAPLDVVSGDVTQGDIVAQAIRDKLASANAVRDNAGYYIGHGKTEF